MLIDGMNVAKLHLEIMLRMRQLRDCSEQALQPFCAAHGITALQLRVLLDLYHQGPQTVSNLARHNCMASANNSALCKKLAGAGLVSRNRDPADERQVLIGLTPRGEEMVKQFCQEQEEVFANLRGQLQPGELSRFLEGMDRLILAMAGGCADCAQAALPAQAPLEEADRAPAERAEPPPSPAAKGA